MTSPEPIVSVIVANFNGEMYLPDAIRSALNQSLAEIEVIVVDDASTDTSAGVVQELARQDGRLRLVKRAVRSGPGAARNSGLAVARGRYVAVLDNDDLMHPSRLEDLVAEAEKSGAEICADDLLVFGDGVTPGSLLTARQRKLGYVSAAEFIASNQLYAREPALGYLKPLIQASFLRAHGITYDPALRIGEDYDLIVKLLASGARFRLLPTIGYFYRKHSQSISHRMSGDHTKNMLAADDRLRVLFPQAAADVARAFDTRRISITRASAYAAIIDALKQHRWYSAGRLSLANPSAAPLLGMPIAARLRRLLNAAPNMAATGNHKRVCLITRQRLIGNSNGSSTYLLALMKALRDRGYRITLIAPSPVTFGRLPFLRLRPEMGVFDSIHIRGAWKFGKNLYVAKDPRIGLSAAVALAARFASRLGIRLPSWDRPAPYAIAAPWRSEDQVFIAQRAPRSAQILLADYCFTTPALPFALLPSARTGVVMHDFFSARAERFRQQHVADSVAELDQSSEIRLLRQADAVIAIQNLEAREIAHLLPDREVFVAPLACRMVAAPQPGGRRTVLFIGSNTAPNVIGLRWFLDAIWPTIRASIGDCELLVAGTVAAARIGDGAAGVRLLGLVPDLDPLYREAGVVISPLTVGSGLKIKLIEALGQGKAVVATRITTEGCDADVATAIFERDEPAAFAQAVIQLLGDDGLRQAKAAQALDAARRHFSDEACYRDLLAFADGATSKISPEAVPSFPSVSVPGEAAFAAHDARRSP